MNYLAHLYLSQSNTGLMIGNYIADFVKGKQILTFPEEIQKGIQMHRAIDSFTDSHAVVLESKKRLYHKYHKYSGVIVDMFYDHLLAKNWADFSPIPLTSFTASAYQLLNASKEIFPEKAQHFLYYMSKGDWLSNYSTFEGINKALTGLSKRTSFPSKMEESTADLQKDYQLYKVEFDSFFPELFEHCSKWTVLD